MTTDLVLIFIFAGIGLADALYLSWHAMKKTPVACLWFPPEWCAKVQQSPYSKTLGIPNPYLGLGMYLGIITLATLFMNGVVPFLPLAVLIVVGFLFSLYFLAIQAFVLKAFCTWCVVSALNFIALFLTIILR